MGDSRQQFEAQLVALRHSLQRMGRVMAQAEVRIGEVGKGLDEGKALSAVVGEEQKPLAVEVLREAVAEIAEAVGRFQRSEARALYDEGVTMAEIARLFGISRPRVSKLLRESGVPVGGNRRRGSKGTRTGT